LFRRAVELGLLLGGADRTTHLFGRQITRRYGGKLQTVLDRRNEGHPVLRSYYQTSFVKQYEKAETLLRTETCINNTYHLNVGRRLENLPTLVERMAETNQRFLDAQAELLASTVDQGELARLAQPVQVGKRRVPGLRLQDDRVIRLLDVLLHPGSFVADWTSRDALARLLDRHRLTETDYRLTQLRYDLGKLRAHGLVERIGRTRRYRLTAPGLKLGVLLVKFRTRLLGPLTTLVTASAPQPQTTNDSAVEAAFRQVDLAIDHLCTTLGLKSAA
jgi:DNA-binding transcriptional ArsR family regulator